MTTLSDAVRADRTPKRDPRASLVERPLPAQQRGREVVIRLSNGRRARAVIAPEVARRSDVAAIARASADNHRRGFKALRRQSREIERLREVQQAMKEKVEALQNQSDQALIGLARDIAGLDRAVGAAAAQATTVVATTTSRAARQIGDAKTAALRAQFKNVTNVVHTVQATAFGDKGRLFSTNNLLLAGNQLFWSLFDTVLERLGVLNATSATFMAALAPIGSLATGQVLLGERPHVRYISGTTEFNNLNEVVSISLRDQVGEHLWPEFRNRTDVPVIAAFTGVSTVLSTVRFFAVLSLVDQGTLKVAVIGRRFEEGSFQIFPIHVAWTVDTGADVG